MIYNVENLSKNREWCDKESELKRSIEEYEIVLKKADLTKSEVRKLIFELVWRTLMSMFLTAFL